MLFLIGSDAFEQFRKKTMPIEIISSIGFLVTGIIMIVKLGGGAWMGANGWFHLKLTLVILGIPLGIIGLKRNNKLLVGLSVLFFVVVFFVAYPHTRALIF